MDGAGLASPIQTQLNERNTMTQFIGRRLLLLIPVMIGVILVTFTIVRLIPGNPCVTMLGERATPEKCQAFMQRYGLNDNIVVQFGR